jgi:hypothetical protein
VRFEAPTHDLPRQATDETNATSCLSSRSIHGLSKSDHCEPLHVLFPHTTPVFGAIAFCFLRAAMGHGFSPFPISILAES